MRGLLHVRHARNKEDRLIERVRANFGKEEEAASRRVVSMVKELEAPVQPLKIVPDTKPEVDAQLARWVSYVDRAKTVVRKLNKDRMKVAKLAIAACDIKHGGGNHWKDFEGVYTLRRFAEEVGVSYKTLHNWVMIKKEVAGRLPKGMFDEANWGAAVRTRNKVDKKTATKRLSRSIAKKRTAKVRASRFIRW